MFLLLFCCLICQASGSYVNIVLIECLSFSSSYCQFILYIYIFRIMLYVAKFKIEIFWWIINFIIKLGNSLSTCLLLFNININTQDFFYILLLSLLFIFVSQLILDVSHTVYVRFFKKWKQFLVKDDLFFQALFNFWCIWTSVQYFNSSLFLILPSPQL